MYNESIFGNLFFSSEISKKEIIDMSEKTAFPAPSEMHARAIPPTKVQHAADLYTDVSRCLAASDGRWSSERDFFGIETAEYTAVMIRPGTTKDEVDSVVDKLRTAGYYVDDSCPDWAEVKIPTVIYISWNPLVIEAGAAK